MSAPEQAFLPAALEIQETPPAALGRAVLWVIAALFVAAVTWASLGQVDIVAVARGRIIASGHSKTVQPLAMGTVAAIHVAEGQAVEAGEVLIELDPAAAEADVGRLSNAQQAATQELERWQGLAARLAPTAPSGPGETTGDALLEGRWQAFQARLEVLVGERGRLEAERRSAQRRVDKLTAILPIVSRRATDQAALSAQQLLPEQQALAAEQERLETFHELKTHEGLVEELGAALQAVDFRRAATRSEFRREVLERREAARQRLETVTNDLVKARVRRRAQTLRAPVAGTVQQLAVHNVGAVVTPAQALAVVVPRDAGLEVEAVLENKDVGFVTPGQAAAIKVDAFPFTRYGTLAGEITGLARDAVADAQAGLVYTVRARLARTSLEVDGRPVALGPGMAVTVEVTTGRRRLIEFLLGPLMRYRDESVRER